MSFKFNNLNIQSQDLVMPFC